MGQNSTVFGKAYGNLQLSLAPSQIKRGAFRACHVSQTCDRKHLGMWCVLVASGKPRPLDGNGCAGLQGDAFLRRVLGHDSRKDRDLALLVSLQAHKNGTRGFGTSGTRTSRASLAATTAGTVSADILECRTQPTRQPCKGWA